MSIEYQMMFPGPHIHVWELVDVLYTGTLIYGNFHCVICNEDRVTVSHDKLDWPVGGRVEKCDV